MSATAFQRRRRELARQEAERARESSAPAPAAPPVGDLPDTLDEKVRELLEGAGFTTLESVRLAADSQLTAIKGIGPKLLAEIRAGTE